MADFEKDFAAQCRRYFAEIKMNYQGWDIDDKTPKAYRDAILHVEQQIFIKSKKSAELQNKHYYEMRVHELREKKDDEISLSMARMLMKELNMRVDDLKSTTPIARNKLQSVV